MTGACALSAAACSIVNAPGGSGTGGSAADGTGLGPGGSGAHHPTGGGGTGASGGGSGGDCGSLTTLQNCGQCGHPCAPDHATGPTCATGSCDYAACNAGYYDCDGDRSNGCEAGGPNDLSNCGGCAQPCDGVQHVTAATCVNATCDYQQCAPLYGDCDGNRSNGCERPTNTLSDCGGCATPCAPSNVAGPTCANGSCGYASCVAPFLDCDGNAGNGCEANTSSDLQHCGGCNQPCAGSCNNGLCSVLVTTVCGLPTPYMLAGGDCSNNHDQYATWYCQLAGYTSAVSFTVLTSGVFDAIYYEGGASAVLSNCSQAIYGPTYGLNASCDAIRDLYCH